MSTSSSIRNFDIYELDKIHHLSIRVMNTCLNSGLVTLYAILNHYFKHGTFTYLRRCGVKCNNELIELCQYYITKYKVSKGNLSINAADQSFDEFKMFIHTNFGLASSITETYRECYHKKEFHLFSFILTLLDRSVNDKELYIFLHNYGFINGHEKNTYQEIGDTFGLTRERARQIFKSLPKILNKTILRLKKSNLPLDVYIHQYDDKDNYPFYYKIDEAFVNEINERENINITPKFCCYVLSAISDKNFRMIQSIESNYNCYYAINKTFYDKVKLDSIFNYIESYNKDKRRLDINIDITKLIKENLNYSNEYIVENEVLRRFIIDFSKTCFGLNTIDSDYIVVPRNTLTKISEHITSILRKQGNPMTLQEIHTILSQETDKRPTIESLRSSILNCEDVIAIGKTSTYALKEWDWINTKRIKDIVYDFLKANPDKSLTIAEITEHVCQYRQTNAKNIRTNLRLDNTGRFIFKDDNTITINHDK